MKIMLQDEVRPAESLQIARSGNSLTFCAVRLVKDPDAREVASAVDGPLEIAPDETL
jgi:hypothetical protein